MASNVDPNVDPYAFLGITRNPDGSITRTPPTLPHQHPENPTPFLNKDLPINQENKTWARVYLPRMVLDASPTKKIPLIIYYHGGGFIVGNVESPVFQKFCSDVAMSIPAVVLSVEYRLAPEHRLPAAYDDCVEVLHWIKTTGDEWLTKFADLSKCFLMGSSAGGNIAYHVGLRVIKCVGDLLPLKIQGLILHQPFFGGVNRTPSEVRLIKDRILPPSLADIMWELCLPVGADRDHEYCNPMLGTESNVLEKAKGQAWRILVTGYGGDPCVDRQIEFVKMLEEKGLDVIGELRDGGCHGCEFFDSSTAEILYSQLKNFVLNFSMNL